MRDGEQLTEAIEVALRTLASRRQTDAITRLLGLGRNLLQQLDGWRTAPPSAEVREQIMRRVVWLHLEVVRAARAADATD